MGEFYFGITGLAACYRKSGEEFWNIVFPTDNDHRVKLHWWKDTEKYGPEDLADRKVKITVTGSEAPVGIGNPYEDDSFKNVIDLTANYLHVGGLTTRPPSPNQQQGNEQRGSLKLEILHAKLFSLLPRAHRLNYVFPFDNPADIILIQEGGIPTVFSILVLGEINFEKDIKVTISTEEGETIAELIEGDAFLIDNDCNGQTIRNDFQRYQDLFDSKTMPGKRFEMISIRNPNPEPPSQETEVTRANAAPFAAAALFHDLILEKFTEPPPLICDTVRISNTDHLIKDI